MLVETMEKVKNIIYEHLRKEFNSCNVLTKGLISEFLCARRFKPENLQIRLDLGKELHKYQEVRDFKNLLMYTDYIN